MTRRKRGETIIRLAILIGIVLACATAFPQAWRRQPQTAFGTEPEHRERPRPEIPPSPPERSGFAKRSSDRRELDRLAERLGAYPIPIRRPCRNKACTERALDGFFRKLDRIDRTKQGRVRVLQLGDSHIAADYITRTIRGYLQDRFGDAGRGFVAVAQHAQYGGRLSHRQGWERHRIVDPGRARQPFGFSGMSLVSERTGASARYRLRPDDRNVLVYYHAQEGGPELEVYAGGSFLTAFSTNGARETSRVTTIPLPTQRFEDEKPLTGLRLKAGGPGATVFGLSFESGSSGILYDSIGPVGADARSYLSLEPESFRTHLQALRPDLVVLMVGGNDSLAVRQGKRRLRDVRRHHRELVARLQDSLPKADIMLWSLMDAGRRERGRIVSKRFIRQVRNIQRAVAKDAGCAFWDTFEAMGGEGAFGRWLNANIMNEDLVHPRSRGGDLLGHLFAVAFMEAYLAAGSNTNSAKSSLR